MLKSHLLRAQHRIKHQVDHKRTERKFAFGDQVLLKLQPYVQSSVVSRPCPKLAYKIFDPYKILTHVSSLAYKLDHRTTRSIRFFHVSQLKPFTTDHTPVFTKLPAPPDLMISHLQPQAILERRLIKKGNAAIPQGERDLGRLSRAPATFPGNGSRWRGPIPRKDKCHALPFSQPRYA